MILNTVKPQLSGHFGTFLKCPLDRGCKNCVFVFNDYINIQRLLCAVIKFHVVKKAIQSLSSLPFVTNFNLFVKSKALTQGPKVTMAGARSEPHCFVARNPNIMPNVCCTARSPNY